MKITSPKIPASFPELPKTCFLLEKYGDDALILIVSKLYRMPGSPSNASCTFKQVGAELMKLLGKDFQFKFYMSKNVFIGHNVISHANNVNTINYNTRFHSVKKFTIKDWFKNYFHELTHLADQASVYNFDHDGQDDNGAAPMVVAKVAGEVFDENISKWL